MSQSDKHAVPIGNFNGTVLTADNTAAIFLDSKNRIVETNGKAHEWFGDFIPQQTLLNDLWLSGQGINLSDRRFRNVSIESLLTNKQEDRYIGFSLPKETHWMQWQFVQLQNNPNADKALLLVEVTDLMQALHSLEQHAEDADTRDFATGLYNRRYAMERLEQMHQHAKRYHSPFAIAMVDIDHFKRINDTFGHAYGDEVLGRLAEVIRKSFRETDLCSRFGGEEFLLLMPETETNDAIFSLDRLRQQVSELKWDQMQRPVTISSGVIAWQTNKSVEQLIFLADQRLTTAKKAGRNQVCGDLL